MDNRSAARNWVVIWLSSISGNRWYYPHLAGNCCNNDSL